MGDQWKQRKAELTALEAKLAEPPPPKMTRADLFDRIGKALAPLERLITEGRRWRLRRRRGMFSGR